MTRTAPYLTLGAVAVLGGGLFLANGLSAPAAPGGATPVVAAAPAAAPAPAPATVPGPAAVPEAPAAAPAPAAAAPAPGDDAPAAPRVGGDADYAGLTDDGDMTVAISVRGGDVTAYVCGAGLEVWLRGTASADGELDLTSASGRSTLTGTGAAGEFVSDGVTRDYTAEAVDVADAVADGRDDVGEVADRADSGPVIAPEPEPEPVTGSTGGSGSYGSY
jgi:hypothetical protein